MEEETCPGVCHRGVPASGSTRTTLLVSAGGRTSGRFFSSAADSIRPRLPKKEESQQDEQSVGCVNRADRPGVAVRAAGPDMMAASLTSANVYE